MLREDCRSLRGGVAAGQGTRQLVQTAFPLKRPKTLEDHYSNLRRGFNWLGSAAVIAKLTDFATMLAVLWFLTKDQVGVASLVWSIAVVVEATDGMGTGAAIVQSRSLSRLQLDSVFWYAMGTATVAGCLIWLAAPLIGEFYGIPGMALYFLAVAAKLLFTAGALVPLQLLNRELRYERIAVINVCATLGAALTRLAIAVMGGGAWAIVGGYAVHGLYVLIGVQLASPFLPRLRFRPRAISGLVHFGVPAAAADVLQQLFRNVDFLLIGWFYGPASLAVYRVAFDIPMEAAVAVGDLVNRTAMPVFAKVSAARELVAQSFVWATGRIVALVGPLMAAFMLCAGWLTVLIHDANGVSYAAAAWPLRILAAAAILRAVFQLLRPLALGTGQPGMALRMWASALVLLTAGVLGMGMIFDAERGIIAIAAVWLAIYPILFVWGGRFVARTCGLDLRELAKSVAPPAAATAAMVAAVLIIRDLVSWPDPRLQVALAFSALAVTYAGIFLYSRRPAFAG